MFIEVAPDWGKVYTAREMSEDLGGFKFLGPGWYINSDGSAALVTPLRDCEDPWKKDWPASQKFYFRAYSTNPVASFNAVASAPVRLCELPAKSATDCGRRRKSGRC